MWVRRLFERMANRRRGPRVQTEGLVAYYWTGSLPKPNVVRDIGPYGACIVAPDVFYPQTLVQIVLEDVGAKPGDGSPNPHICVCGRVCRRTQDGFCVSFVFGDSHERMRLRHFLKRLKRRNQEVTSATTSDESQVEQLKGGDGPGQSGTDQRAQEETGVAMRGKGEARESQ